MPQSVKVKLALDGGVFAGRYEAPQSWMRLTREAGFACQEFCTNQLDPLLGGDDVSCREAAQSAVEAARAEGVELCGVWSGRGCDRLPGLCHSDAIVRQRCVEWVVGAIDLAMDLKAPILGGRFGRIPQEALALDDHGLKQALRSFCDSIRELAGIGRDKGLQALLIEHGVMAGEAPWTLRQAEEMLIEANRKGRTCPIYLRSEVEVGGLGPGVCADPEGDGRSWLEALGAYTPVVRIRARPGVGRQLELVRESADRVLGALTHAHAYAHGSWVAEVLAPVTNHRLVVSVAEPWGLGDEALRAELTALGEAFGSVLPEGQITLGG